MGRPLHHPAAESITLDGVLYALSDPQRRRIVSRLLACDGMRCNQACSALPPSTVSFHHKVLREAGLIYSEKRGVELFNTVRREDLERRFPGLLAAVLGADTTASSTSV